MYILDTSAFIEIIKNTKKCQKICDKLGEVPAAITVFTLNELLIGAEKKEKQIIEKLIQGITILNFDKESAMKSVEIERYLTKQGKKINKVDLFIASICLVQQKIIVTLDNHFLRIPGLKTLKI
ncbi:type II toxin-antitoxin system VapC family toxin [Candidatus Woesearchaeota archaeon]|nr:type II toxin-antitoxin system VapC family toxin [Candidatus Woesearchaeota archaeon]